MKYVSRGHLKGINSVLILRGCFQLLLLFLSQLLLLLLLLVVTFQHTIITDNRRRAVLWKESRYQSPFAHRSPSGTVFTTHRVTIEKNNLVKTWGEKVKYVRGCISV